MADLGSQLKSPPFLLKWVELILAIVCLSLVQDAGIGYGLNIHKATVVVMVYSGYLLINLMDISRMLAGEKTEKSLALLWSFVGAVLWITAGALVIEYYRTFENLVGKLPLAPQLPSISNIGLKTVPSAVNAALDKLIASGIIALLNALVYLTEAAVTFKFG